MVRAATRTGVIAQAQTEEEEERLGAGGKGGHSVPKQPALSDEEQQLQTRVMEHQKAAARLSDATEIRSLVQYSTGYGVLSTVSRDFEGHPAGSVVGFAADGNGMPIFAFSALSGHTRDLLADAKASMTVTSGDFKGAADARVNLLGRVTKVEKEEVDSLKALYKAKHPKAFWVDFKDFTWFRMTELLAVRFVGGFARAADVTPEEYLSSAPDPIMAFSGPVAGHMNIDHSESTKLMIRHYVGVDVETADINSLDSLGMLVKCTRGPDTFKLRLPFPRQATDRKDVKTLIVQMTRESAAGMQPSEAA